MTGGRGTLHVEQHQQEEIHVHEEAQVHQERREEMEHPAVTGGLELPQPAQAEAAPAPVMEEPVQQQGMSYKQRRALRSQFKKVQKNIKENQRRQERERQQQEAAAREAKKQQDRAIAKMHVTIQPILEQMKADPELAVYYEMSASDTSLVHAVDAIEDCFLASYEDKKFDIHVSEGQARKLLERAQALRNFVRAHDERRQSLYFAESHLDYYVEEHNIQLPEGTREALSAYSDQFDQMRTQLFEQIEALRRDMFPGLSHEEIEERMKNFRRVQKGKDAPAYRELYAEKIQSGEMADYQARGKFEEGVLRERRPETLRQLEERRKAQWDEVGPLTIRGAMERHELFAESESSVTAHIRNTYDPNAPKINYEFGDFLTREYLEEAIRNASFQIRVPNCQIMGLILDSKRFKTQMETNSSGAMLDLSSRKAFAENNFGINAASFPVDQYEIYGYASDNDLVRESQQDSTVGSRVKQYGSIVVTLKKDRMLERTTTTIGDSLNGKAWSRMNFVHSPDLQCVNDDRVRKNVIAAAYKRRKEKAAGKDVAPADVHQVLEDSLASYVELQYHGGVNLEDIESVTLMADAYEGRNGTVTPEQDIPAELVERLKTLGIKAYKVKDGKQNEL